LTNALASIQNLRLSIWAKAQCLSEVRGIVLHKYETQRLFHYHKNYFTYSTYRKVLGQKVVKTFLDSFLLVLKTYFTYLLMKPYAFYELRSAATNGTSDCRLKI